MNIYETERLVQEYLLFHYGDAAELLPWPQAPEGVLDFPVRTVRELLRRDLVGDGARALDLGCAVGRSSFELSVFCDEVVGIDFSQAFVDAANHLREVGERGYQRLEEAGRYTEAVARVPVEARRGRVRFEQGDAMHLRADLGVFDVVHAANLLCRLPEPLLAVRRFASLVKPGGQLLLTTPCTWLEEFTPPDLWPPDGRTFEWLRGCLEGDFELDYQGDMPFMIRETARKYQWTVAMATRWVRR